MDPLVRCARFLCLVRKPGNPQFGYHLTLDQPIFNSAITAIFTSCRYGLSFHSNDIFLVIISFVKCMLMDLWEIAKGCH